jgi:CRP-like cAMP-binding protein
VWHFDVIALDPTDVLRFDAEAVRSLTDTDANLDRALTEVIATTMARRLEAARLQLLDLYGRPS